MNDLQIAHLMAHAEKDPVYQELLQLQRIYQPEFYRILQLLSPQDQNSLTMYIRICTELESRTAYFLTPEC